MNIRSFLNYFILSCAVSLLFSSCAAPSSPKTRIAENQKLFESMTPKFKSAIAKGQIEQGMDKNAVFLAWGKADKEVDLFKNNKRTTVWHYTKLVPVYTNYFRTYVTTGNRYGYAGCYPSSSWGWGGYYGHGYHGAGDYFSMDSGVSYRPTDAARVTFENEKVAAWEVER